jgi:hypothetical protein
MFGDNKGGINCGNPGSDRINCFKRNILKVVISKSPLWKGYEENIDHPTMERRILEENKYVIRGKKSSTLILLNMQDVGIETVENRNSQIPRSFCEREDVVIL